MEISVACQVCDAFRPVHNIIFLKELVQVEAYCRKCDSMTYYEYYKGVKEDDDDPTR